MQQHACERQDGRTTLGPQCFWETISGEALRGNLTQEAVPQVKHRQQPTERKTHPSVCSCLLLLFQCQGKRGRGKTDRTAAGKLRIQRCVTNWDCLSPSVSSSIEWVLEPRYHVLICTHIRHPINIGQMLQTETPSLILLPLLSNIRTTQAALDTLHNLAAIWHVNQGERHVKKLYSITIQYNEPVHEATIKERLCPFNSDGKEKNKTDIPGAAASAACGRRRQELLWNNTVTLILFAGEKLRWIRDRHEITAAVRVNVMKAPI